MLKYRHRGVGVEKGRRQERHKGSVCPRRAVITCAILLVTGKSTDDMKYLQPHRKEKLSGLTFLIFSLGISARYSAESLSSRPGIIFFCI